MLEATVATQLKGHFEKLQVPVKFVATLDDSAKSAELKELLEELASFSPQLSLELAGDSSRVPAFDIVRTGTEVGVRFAGIPLGHEFTSLVLAILQVGGHPSTASAETLEVVRSLPAMEFETFFSLTCQNCPDVVQALNLMSIINPKIRHTSIDGALNQSEVESRGVLAVPTVFLNGEVFGQGRMTLDEIVAKLDTTSAAKAAAAIAEKPAFDVLVVGGGPAGAAAAIYAARKGIRTGLAGQRMGGQVLDTMDIENLVSIIHTEGPKLGAALEAHINAYDVDVMPLQEAAKLTPAGSDGLVSVELASGAVLKSKTVILSTGARWRTMNVPGEDAYRNKGVTFCPHCDGPLFKGKRVAVIGGGNSGVEAAIDLAGVVGHVTLIEFDPQLRADEVLQRKLRSLPNVDIITSAQTTAVGGDGKKVTGLSYLDRTGGAEHSLELDGVFVQIGLLPNTEWLKGAVELSPRGEVVIDSKGQTSLPGVFAAGDCTTVPYKQIVIALGAGATAALAAFDHLIRTSAPAN